MKMRKHFRTSIATTELIYDDFSFNRIGDKQIYFKYCVNERVALLSKKYDEKLDKILTFIIRNCDYDNLPTECIARVIMSLTKITNTLSKGIIYMIEK